MKKVLILLLVGLPTLIVVAALLWAMGAFTQAVPVDLVEASLSTLQRDINTNGKIEAERIIELRAPTAGTCRRITVREGARLRKGEVILRIEDTSLSPQLAQAQTELDAAQLDLFDVQRGPAPEEVNQAEAEIARAKSGADDAAKVLETNEWLLARQAISRYEVDQSRRSLSEAQQTLAAAQTRLQDITKRYGDLDRRRAQSRVDAAQARIQFLKESMERLIVRAPADGTLYELNVKEGAFLNTGDPIGLIADLGRLRVRAFVDEPDIGQVTLGERVLVRWDAHPQEVWNGTVTHLPAQVVALGTRSVAEVLCAIDNPNGTLIPNINVDVQIQPAEGTPVNSLPRTVVFPEGTREYVWTIENGRAVKHFLQTGRSTSARIEIVGGLPVGSEVIDPGDMLITDGLKVRARQK